MTTAPRVLVVGDLVSDIRVAPTEPLAAGEEVTGRVSMSGGGSAANQAAWLARLGAAVTFVGRVGDDLIGSALEEELERAGVAVRAVRDRLHPTGTVARLFAAYPGAARLFAAYPGAARFREQTSGAQWLFPSSSEALALAEADSDQRSRPSPAPQLSRSGGHPRRGRVHGGEPGRSRSHCRCGGHA